MANPDVVSGVANPVTFKATASPASDSNDVASFSSACPKEVGALTKALYDFGKSYSNVTLAIRCKQGWKLLTVHPTQQAQ